MVELKSESVLSNEEKNEEPCLPLEEEEDITVKKKGAKTSALWKQMVWWPR